MAKSREPSIAVATRNWGIATLIAMGALALLSIYLGSYLWDRAAGRTWVFFVYLFWMAVMLGAAGVAASFFTHLLFPSAVRAKKSPHRRRNQVTPEDDDFMEPDEGLALFQPLTLYYSVFVVVLLVGAISLSDALSDNALGQFVRIQYEAMSRSQDKKEVLSLFQELTEMEQSELVDHFTRTLPEFYDNTDREIREAAFHTTAIMARRTNISVAILNQNGELSDKRWEPDLLMWLKEKVSPELRTLYRQRVEPRDEIVLALAWIIRGEDAAFYAQILGASNTPGNIQKNAATGLGNIGNLAAGEQIVQALPNIEGEVRLQALWALHLIGENAEPDIEEEDRAQRILELCRTVLNVARTFEPPNLCAALLALRPFQHAGVTRELIDWFESHESDLQCPRIELMPLYGAPNLFVTQDDLRWHILEFLADIGRNNPTLHDWLTSKPRSADYSTRAREGLDRLRDNVL